MDHILNYIKVEMRACFGLSEEQVSNKHDTVVKTFLKNHWHLIDEDGDNRIELKLLRAFNLKEYTYYKKSFEIKYPFIDTDSVAQLPYTAVAV